MSLETAVTTYLERTYLGKHPVGRTDHGRWNEDSGERAECCRSVRAPSRAYPWSMYKHCFSMKHIACLHGVEVSEVRGALKSEHLPRLIGTAPRIDALIAEVLSGKRKKM